MLLIWLNREKEECKQYCSDFRYIVKYLACKGDKVKLDRFFMKQSSS